MSSQRFPEYGARLCVERNGKSWPRFAESAKEGRLCVEKMGNPELGSQKVLRKRSVCSKDVEFLGHYGAATELSRHYSGCH